MDGLTPSDLLAGPMTSTSLGWRGDAIAIAMGLFVGVFLNIIPKLRNAKTWRRIVIGAVAGVIVYVIASFVMGYFFHEHLD